MLAKPVPSPAMSAPLLLSDNTCPFLHDKNTSPEQSGAWFSRSALRDELGDLLEVRVGARKVTQDATAREHDDLISHRHRLL
jgi:hypothetical protein